MNISNVIAAGTVLVLAGCNSQSADQQPANGSEIVETAQPSTDSMTVNDASGTQAPTSNEVTSGMPVPGTNTPEHVVVNEVTGNSD